MVKKKTKAKKKKTKAKKKKTSTVTKQVEERSEFYIVHTCSCGHDIKQLCLDMSNSIPHVHMQMLGQTEFECPECDKRWAYGDIDYIDVDEMFGG